MKLQISLTKVEEVDSAVLDWMQRHLMRLVVEKRSETEVLDLFRKSHAKTQRRKG